MHHSQAYLNGAWVDGAQLSLPLDDLGVTVGAAIVERLRTFVHRPFQVEGHTRRLRRSLELAGWDAARLAAEVEQAIYEFPRRNAAQMAAGDDWSIVAIVTPGTTADAAHPTVCVHGMPLPFAAWADEFDRGVATCISHVRHIPANCLPPEMKCRSRMHYYLADRDAERRFPGSRALLLDQEGRVAEASTANVVCYFRDRGLVTPPIGGVLPGISQEVLFSLAADLGWQRLEQDIRREDLLAADEVFLASTSVCLLAVVSVDGEPIGGGAPGPVYRQLLGAWSHRVGVEIPGQARQFAER